MKNNKDFNYIPDKDNPFVKAYNDLHQDGEGFSIITPKMTDDEALSHIEKVTGDSLSWFRKTNGIE